MRRVVGVVAQGGAARGYTLFVEDGKLVFLVRAAGQVTRVATREPVNLQGVDRRLAVNYQSGDFVIFNVAVATFTEGSEARVLVNNPRGNAITVSDREGEFAASFARVARMATRRNGPTAESFGTQLKTISPASARYLNISP